MRPARFDQATQQEGELGPPTGTWVPSTTTRQRDVHPRSSPPVHDDTWVPRCVPGAVSLVCTDVLIVADHHTVSRQPSGDSAA